jgi:signal transduction histidine kinase
MARGAPAPSLPEGPQDEIGQLVRAFNEMTREVEARNRQNQKLSEQLQRRSLQQGRLLRRLTTAQEDERLRVARELHDELGQSLTGLSLRAQALERHIAADNAWGQEILDQMRTLVKGTTEQMYDIIMDLRPSVLDDLGLVSALRAYADRALQGGELELSIDDDRFKNRLPAEIETTLFRAFQEGITNVVRHADATRICITLTCDDHLFEGMLVDDGRGFDLSAVQPNGHNGRGLGLLGMQERMIQCGGQMEIDTAPGQGTRVRFSLTLPEKCHGSQN